MIKSSTGLSDTIICILELQEINQALLKAHDMHVQSQSDINIRPQTSTTTGTANWRLNPDLSQSFERTLQPIQSLNYFINYKGKQFERQGLIQYGDKILHAINNSCFAWKDLVQSSF